MPDFYVEGCTAEGVPYGPVHVLTTPIVEDEFDEGALEAWEDAWRDAVMREIHKLTPYPMIVSTFPDAEDECAK